MQQKLHPVRYRDTMARALERFEAIARDTARPERLAAEFEGMTPDELASCRDRLNVLEPLIADWAAGGRTVYDAGALPTELLASEPARFRFDGDMVARPLYVHFGHRPHLQLGDGSPDVVEGLYLRRAGAGAACELTFVCGGSGWDDLDSRPYRDALRYASRMAKLTADLAGVFPDAVSPGDFEGDAALVADGALGRAVSAAGVVLSILSAGSGDGPPGADRFLR